jgi:hypothetical protein
MAEQKEKFVVVGPTTCSCDSILDAVQKRGITLRSNLKLQSVQRQLPDPSEAPLKCSTQSFPIGMSTIILFALHSFAPSY